MYQTLRVGTVMELVDAYTTTASKILSLWEKHGEQEGEVERLEEEIKAGRGDDPRVTGCLQRVAFHLWRVPRGWSPCSV